MAKLSEMKLAQMAVIAALYAIELPEDEAAARAILAEHLDAELETADAASLQKLGEAIGEKYKSSMKADALEKDIREKLALDELQSSDDDTGDDSQKDDKDEIITALRKQIEELEAKKSQAASTIESLPESGKVIVFCKLPAGLEFTAPDGKTKIVLNGANKAEIIGSGYGKTTLAAAEWEYIVSTYQDAVWLRKGLVYASSEKKGTAQANDPDADGGAGFAQIDLNKKGSALQEHKD